MRARPHFEEVGFDHSSVNPLPNRWSLSAASSVERIGRVAEQRARRVEPRGARTQQETVRRLTQPVRRSGNYDRSLQVLQTIKDLDPTMLTKSGLMLGHGETEAEVLETLSDLRAVGCDCLTLGQYLQPSLEHRPVSQYWTPAEFEQLGSLARHMGFRHVRSGPLVRSSYHAAAMTEAEGSPR